MKELSVFIDESGDFGKYSPKSPYYIISMLFHDQSHSVVKEVSKLNQHVHTIGFSRDVIHVGPLVRRENEYINMSLSERRRLLYSLTYFARNIEYYYASFYVDKKHIPNEVEQSAKLSKQMAQYIRNHYPFLLSYDVIKVYYDNGQVEVTKIITAIFTSLFEKVELKKAFPKDYKLFQVNDLLCTFKLFELKARANNWSKSEKIFFKTQKNFYKNYYKAIKTKLLE